MTTKDEFDKQSKRIIDHFKEYREYREELRRFNKTLNWVISGVVGSVLLSGLGLILTITDDKSELLRLQIELQHSTIQELQESRDVLFRIEENGRQVEVKDTLVD